MKDHTIPLTLISILADGEFHSGEQLGSLHYLLSTQNKTPSWQSLRHNPLFPCPCAGDDRENRACEKKCESNHI